MKDPQITYMEEIQDVADGQAIIKRNIGSGWEIVRVKLPALLTVLETSNTPRPKAAKRVMRYKSVRVPAEVTADEAKRLAERGKLLEQWNLDDIGADLDRCGVSGSPTKVFRIQSIVLKKEGYSTVAPTKEGVSTLIHELVTDKTLG